MMMMSNNVIEMLKRPNSDRSGTENESICAWMSQHFKVFAKVDEVAVNDIIANSRVLECDPNLIIIKQGEIGATFFIILKGRVSVYINTDAVPDGSEERASSAKGSPKKEKTDNFVKVTDKLKYGNFIGYIETGNGFGEIALISDDIRSATIITEEVCQFLVLEKSVYNRSLRHHQEAEFQAFMNFVNTSPIFSSWAPKYKKQVASSLRHYSFPFEREIIKQGDEIDGLRFIVEGQAKVVMDVTQHSHQYLDAHISSHLSQIENASNSSSDIMKSIAKIKNPKQYEVSLVGPGEIIGDIEQAFKLPTSYKTLIPIVKTEIYCLDGKNYDRLILSKRSQTTSEMLSKWAEKKVLSQFSRPSYQQVPLYQYLANVIFEKKLKLQNKQSETPRRKASASKSNDFIVRGPIIDMFGPGSVFYRNRLLRIKNKKNKKPTNDLKNSKTIQSDPAMFNNKSLDRDPTMVDWETSNTKLNSLENQIQAWYDPNDNATVTQLHRVEKKGSQTAKPGKTIILKPKRYSENGSNLIGEDSSANFAAESMTAI